MSMFVKFDGVDGESQQAGYEGWIEISDYNMTSSAPPSTDLGTGSGVAKPTIHGVSFKTTSGRHTPQINKKYYEGTHYSTVQVVFLKMTGAASAEKYFEMTMSHVFVTSIGNGKSADSLGTESITLLAEEYKQEYFSQDSAGVLTSVGSTTYNTKTNESS